MPFISCLLDKVGLNLIRWKTCFSFHHTIIMLVAFTYFFKIWAAKLKILFLALLFSNLRPFLIRAYPTFQFKRLIFCLQLPLVARFFVFDCFVFICSLRFWKKFKNPFTRSLRNLVINFSKVSSFYLKFARRRSLWSKNYFFVFKDVSSNKKLIEIRTFKRP